jgi:hypothetical protein
LLHRTHDRSIRGAVIIAVTVMSVALAPVSAFAWGAAAHRYIMERAIDLLPREMRPFFMDHRDEVVLRVNDPDLWRTAGFDDDANHFVDFGVSEFGPCPFTGLPRDFDAAIEKFGIPALRRFGLLPWREAEEFGNLRRAFEGFARGSEYAPSDTVLFASVAAHYMQDAYQPFHATNNYDGQLTNQNGVHARFETALFERFESRLTINPPPRHRPSILETQRLTPCSAVISSSLRCCRPTRRPPPGEKRTTTTISKSFSPRFVPF